MKKKKIKPKWKNIIILIIILVCIITLFISTKDIIKWMIDSNKTEEQIEKITEMVEIEEVEESENTEIIEQKEEPPKENPYWDYIKMNMINVNFNDLKQKNPDTKGWIQVNGTNINYPFVQTNNNEFYLNHTFNKTYNSAGWVFLDYRNNINELSRNTIIYAHGRLDTTMFGSLKNILSNGWLNNTNNYVVKLSTETENTLWQVFSIYHIKTTSDYLKVNFDSDEDFLEFSDMLIERSLYNFNTKLTKDSKILTLSTCYNDEERMAIHAKLIKKESR